MTILSTLLAVITGMMISAIIIMAFSHFRRRASSCWCGAPSWESTMVPGQRRCSAADWHDPSRPPPRPGGPDGP